MILKFFLIALLSSMNKFVLIAPLFSKVVMEFCRLRLIPKLDYSKLAINGTWIMSNDMAIYLSKQLLWNALIISAPVVLTALLIGLFVSVAQVVTQIQDATLSFVPKVLAVVLVLILCSGWMLHALVKFAQELFLNIPGMIQS